MTASAVNAVPKTQVERPLVAIVMDPAVSFDREGLSVEDLAPHSRLTRWTLEKQFKDAVGHSLHRDLVRVRLAEAHRLLRTTDLPIKVIAPRVGFHSVPHIITVFRRRFGITPARFRRLESGRTVAALEGSECDDDGDEAGGRSIIPVNPK